MVKYSKEGVNSMHKRALVTLLSFSVLLAACGQDKGISEIKPLSLSEVSGTRISNLTQQEQSNLVYDYVSNSMVVDSASLIKVSEQDMKGITQTIAGIDEVLKGKQLKRADGTEYISDEFTQFLLLEMAKTPYTWKRTKVTTQGMDAKSRLYFVDVEYQTTSTYKNVIGDSKIVKGSPMEDSLKASRYQEYMSYMSAKETNSPDVQQLMASFTNKWGSIGDILKEQQGKTLLQRTRELSSKSSIGSITYSGLLEDTTMTNSATMTVRYVLKYNYNLGEEMAMGVNALYIKDYNLQGKEKFIDMEEDNDALVKQSLDLVRPFIKNTLTSYNRAVEQSNHIGLYSLYDNYAKYDKYFIELNNTQYTNFGAFAFKVLGREGEQVKVLVEQETKQRAKGTHTSMPTYRDKYIFTMVLSNEDKVLVKNAYLLERILIQEPASIINSIETKNSDAIAYSSSKFTEANEKAVTQNLKDFLQVIYTQDTNSTTFAGLVDMGISDTTMAKIIDYTTNVGDSEFKVNYITNWNTRSNVYVSVDLREIFVLNDYNLDTESTVEMVNRNGRWYIVNYDRRLAIKTEKGKIVEMKGVFTKNSPEGTVDLIFNEETGDIEEVGEAVQNVDTTNRPSVESRLEGEEESTEEDVESTEESSDIAE